MRNLTEVITKQMEWLNRIGIICNSSKTGLIAFGTKELKLVVEDGEFHSKQCIKILGLLVDSKLSWENHISSVIQKSKSQIFALRYVRTFLNVKETCKVLKSHFASV